METKLVNLTFQLPPELRRALKIHAARRGLPVRALLADQVAALLETDLKADLKAARPALEESRYGNPDF